MDDQTQEPRVVVFAPSPVLTVTVESKGDDADVHLHAGGQGVWIARMVAALGLPVTVCGSFGGETGGVVRTLIEQEGLRVAAVKAQAGNAAYVHDRRSGSRVVVAEMPVPTLPRHEVDELYGVVLVEALEATVCVLAGSTTAAAVPADTYRRLATDLGANGRTVVADLSGEPRRAVLEGGVRALKVSDEELRAEGTVVSDRVEDLLGAVHALRAGGAADVVISRAGQPALATLGEDVVAVEGPRLAPLDVRGAGDSMTAGIVAALARGQGFDAALRLGAAAGGLNVTRRGLATGHREEIERLAAHIELRPLTTEPRPAEAPVRAMTPDELAAHVRPI